MNNFSWIARYSIEQAYKNGLINEPDRDFYLSIWGTEVLTEQQLDRKNEIESTISTKMKKLF